MKMSERASELKFRQFGIHLASIDPFISQLAESIEKHLAAMEGLGVTRGRGCLDSTQPHQAMEEVNGKPLLVSLRTEIAHQRLNSSAADRLGQRHEKVWRSQVSVVLRDLVLKDEVIPEGIPC